MIALDEARGVMTVGGEDVPLTQCQFRVASLLWRRRDETVPREDIMDALYGDDPDRPRPKIIDVFVCHARRALRDMGAPCAINAVYRQGYRLDTF